MTIAAQHLTDDLTLVNLLKQGNELAFQAIYNLYWEKLFSYTYNRLHVREASEEVVQDVFCSLWDKRESLNITTSLSGYLYGATKHRLLNEFRSEKVRSAYVSDFATFVKNLHDNSNLEYQELRALEDTIELRVSELPRQCQAVYRLSRQDNIPNQRIAERLNISIKTVENHLTHALKYIRTSLGEFLIIFVVVMVFC